MADMFQAVAENIDEALIAYDADFTMRVFNARAEDMFGIKAADIIGKQFSLDKAQEPAWSALAPIIYSSLAPTVVRMPEMRGTAQAVKVILDDPHKEFFISTSRVAGPDGAQGFMKIVRDMTREAGLIKSKSDFITIAAHELRTPATAINWTFENLEKEKALSPEAGEAVRVGHAAAQNLLQIITNLLNAAQMEEGKFGYAFQRINLVEFLDGLLAQAIPIARQYGIDVYFERPPASSVIVSGDPVKLGLAIGNLIDNAIKYNAAGGRVVGSITLSEGNAEVRVQDTGMGIPEADISRLFEKFFRAGNAKGAAVQGSGLGLYLVKNIIEGHKGRVWVESVLGRGTVFHFTLPLTQ